MHVQPYLFFAGECEQALAFYESALGATRGVTMRFGESPEPAPEGMIPPGWEDKVMHAEFTVGDSRILASDGCEAKPTPRGGFSLAVSLQDEAEVDRAFAALAEGGKVDIPLAKTFFSPRFGAVTDRFGVSWMLLIG